MGDCSIRFLLCPQIYRGLLIAREKSEAQGFKASVDPGKQRVFDLHHDRAGTASTKEADVACGKELSKIILKAGAGAACNAFFDLCSVLRTERRFWKSGLELLIILYRPEP